MVSWQLLRSIAVATVLVCALPENAHAENVAAEALFRAGRAATARGDHATACTHYRESYRLEQALGTLLNLALCEEALGKLASAWQHYQDVIRDLSAEDQRFAWTRQRLDALEARLPRLTLQVGPQRPDNTRVVVDSKEIETANLGKSLPLDPGTHEVSVLAPERAPREYRVELAEGESKVVTLQVGAAFESQQKPKPQSASKSREASPRSLPSANAAQTAGTRSILAYSTLGLGAGALITSGIAGAFALDRKATVDAECDANRKNCSEAGIAAGDSGSDLLTVAGVGLAVGVVASATGLYLLWTTPDAKTGIVVQPGLQPGSGSIFLKRNF